MTDALAATGAVPSLPADGGEGRPALLSLVAPGGAPVCEGDACLVPGAEGAWSEIPD